MANLGINFLPRNFYTAIFFKGVYYHCTKDLFETREGKPVAAAGSCGHRKNTAKNWENISHLVRGQTGIFDAPELIAGIYFAPKPFISVKITVEEKPRPCIFYNLFKFDRTGELYAGLRLVK